MCDVMLFPRYHDYYIIFNYMQNLYQVRMIIGLGRHIHIATLECFEFVSNRDYKSREMKISTKEDLGPIVDSSDNSVIAPPPSPKMSFNNLLGDRLGRNYSQ